MAWDARRRGWCVTRMSSGFFALWPEPMENDDVMIKDVVWAKAVNVQGRLNQVASYFGGQKLMEFDCERILAAYDILVERGDIQPIELQPEPEPEPEAA